MIDTIHWFQRLDWIEWVLFGCIGVNIAVFICHTVFDKYTGTYD